jgi:putative peptidoglycan lipid II flippase
MWGTAGLTGSAGVAGWIEFALLRNSLNRRIGPTGLSISRMAVLWGSAVAGAVVAWGVKLAIPWTDPLVRGALILPAFGATYLACTAAVGVDVRRQLLRG